MPSKKHILNKIRELENELIKLKAWAFEHYCIDSQENKMQNKSNAVGLFDINRASGSSDTHTKDYGHKDLIDKDYDKGCGELFRPVGYDFHIPCGEVSSGIVKLCKKCRKEKEGVKHG